MHREDKIINSRLRSKTSAKQLLILINPTIPLPQLQQLLEHLKPIWLQFPGIHQLLVVLPPRAQIAFLRNELEGFAAVSFKEVDGFLTFDEPSFILVIAYANLVTNCSNGFRAACMAEGLLSGEG